MRGKIFRSIWFVLLATLTVSFGLTAVFLYDHFTDEQLEQLRGETKLVSQAVTLNGQDYFDRLGDTDFRITWTKAATERAAAIPPPSSRDSCTQRRGFPTEQSFVSRSHRRRSGLCFFISCCPWP